MGSPTLTRVELTDAVNRAVGLSRAGSARMIESILGHITAALAAGEKVKLTGFGTFSLRSKRERLGRNPKTGVEVPITSRRVLGFKACQSVRRRIAKPE